MNLLTEAGHKAALALIDELFDAKPGSPEERRLMELVSLVEDYEKEYHPIPPPSLWSRICFWWECRRHWWQRI